MISVLKGQVGSGQDTFSMTLDPAGSDIFTRFPTLTPTSFDPLGRVSSGRAKVNPGSAPGHSNTFNMITIHCLS